MIAILAGVASAGGIFISGLYRDNAFVKSTWLGSDLVTLFVIIPLLVVALLLATRGSDRAYLVLLGVVDSMLYSYGFYLFGMAFNPFFMIYAAVVSLSIWALVYGLTNLDAIKLSRRFVSIGVGCLVAAVTLLACLKSAPSSNLSPIDGDL